MGNIDITNPEPIKKFFLEEVGIYSLNDDEEANQDESVKAKEQAEEVIRQLEYIGGLITTGAKKFLFAEYFYLTLFCLVFGLIIGFTVDYEEMSRKDSPSNFPYT